VKKKKIQGTGDVTIDTILLVCQKKRIQRNRTEEGKEKQGSGLKAAGSPFFKFINSRDIFCNFSLIFSNVKTVTPTLVRFLSFYA